MGVLGVGGLLEGVLGLLGEAGRACLDVCVRRSWGMGLSPALPVLHVGVDKCEGILSPIPHFLRQSLINCPPS